jgi:hypothetical protein
MFDDTRPVMEVTEEKSPGAADPLLISSMVCWKIHFFLRIVPFKPPFFQEVFVVMFDLRRVIPG